MQQQTVSGEWGDFAQEVSFKFVGDSESVMSQESLETNLLNFYDDFFYTERLIFVSRLLHMVRIREMVQKPMKHILRFIH